MSKFSGFFNNSSNVRIVSNNSGLREYMLGVYNYMTVALGISGVVAFFTAYSGLAQALFSSPLGMIIGFSPLIMSFYLMYKFQKMDSSAVFKFLIIYSVLMGLSLSSIFLMYSSASIAQAFFVTAAMFGSMSIYGYTTNKDLTGMGSFMIMGAIGILIASLVNMFIHNSGLSVMISFLSVIVFTGLTAYDTQKIKHMYYMIGANNNSDSAKKIAIFGAFQLYMDFVVIFVHMLRLLDLARRD